MAGKHHKPVVTTSSENSRFGQVIARTIAAFQRPTQDHLLPDIHRDQLVGADKFLIVHKSPPPGHTGRTGSKAYRGHRNGGGDCETPHWSAR